MRRPAAALRLAAILVVLQGPLHRPAALGAQARDTASVSDRIVHVEAGWVSGAIPPPGPVLSLMPRTAGPLLGLPVGALRDDDQSDLLVLLGLFSDTPDPHFTADDIERQLFDEEAGGGVVPRFWREVSGGRIAPTGHVAPWIRTDITVLEAAGFENGHGHFGPRRREYIQRVVELSDPLVDYRQFDNDGPDGVPDSGDDDGFIDNLVIEYLEAPGSCLGPGIWPHFSGLREGTGETSVPGIPTEDVGHDGTPIRAYLYLNQSATECDGVTIQRGNVIAHEFGHRLGLPDLYRVVEDVLPQGRVWGAGCFELMAGGAWGCGQGVKATSFGPVHLSPYMRDVLGWVGVEVVQSVRGRDYVLEPVQTGGRVLRIPLGEDEDLWVEYRPRLGFDQDLPAGGVLVYHRDAGLSYSDVDLASPDWKPYRYYLIEADGDHEMTRLERHGGNRGEAEDVFAAEGEEVRWVTGSSHPGLAEHGTTVGPVTFHSIRVEDSRAFVRLSTAPDPIVAVPTTTFTITEGFESSFEIQGGVPPYRALDEFQALGVVHLAVERDRLLVSIERVPPIPLEIAVGVEDGQDQRAVSTVRVTGPDSLDLQQVLTLLLAPESVPELGGAAATLDGLGNGNGFFDVGDFRAVGADLIQGG